MHYYLTANKYFKDLFGAKVYKIALDGGFSCPHRDADKKGGCIFCSEGGSGDFAEKNVLGIDQQINQAISRVISKKPQKFIAYFQSFTNTYGSVEKLKSTFLPAINHPKISALSIATRPDCLSDEIIELLKELNKIAPIFIELGFQTSNEEIANFINRGYCNQVYLDAVNRLKKANLNVITHLIIGLPFATLEDEIKSLNLAINAKTDGVKLQLLHILKNTKLSEIYEKIKYKPLEMEEYIYRLKNLIKIIPSNVVVHRLTGDAPKKLLIAPLWSADKKRVLNAIKKEFEKENIFPK